MKMLDKLRHILRNRTSLLIIITAALLLELLSASQYYFTRVMVGEQLEKRAENELAMKAILIKSNINSAEDILKNHIWDIRENLYHPDSVYEALGRMIVLSRSVHGGAVAFMPNYYPSKERLFEPYVMKNGDSIVKKQIARPTFDYTNTYFFKKIITTNEALWSRPFIDEQGAQTLVVSYGMPLYDKTNALAGMAAVDVSLDWLSDTIDKRHIYPSSFVLLLTKDGKPILMPSEKRVSKNTAMGIIDLINDSTVARHESGSGRSKVIHFNTKDRDGTVFYANMRGEPKWQIAVVCYDDEVYESLMQLRLVFLLLMLLAFGILLYMISRFARNEKKLQKKTMEEERIAGELRIAKDIQQSLLPVEEEAFSGFDYVGVEGKLIPAKEVGGDLYNAFIRDGKLFFCIGDVSGKGIPAAIIMAIIQTLFRNIATRENNPAHIMTQLNEAACRNNKTNVFVTMFIGVFDLPTGHLRYCNAGHEIPIIIRHSASGAEQRSERKDAAHQYQSSFLEAKSNLPIGLFNDFSYEMQKTVLEPGSTLFLYTDGLTEARNKQGKLLGSERLLQMIDKNGTTVALQLVEMVTRQVEKFTADAEQSDDLTLLAISYTPKEEKYVLDDQLTLHNNVKEVEELSSFIKEMAEKLNIGKSLAFNLRLALEEAVVNVMEYAYPAGTAGDVNIRVTFNGQRLNFIITDTGISFNPTEASTANTSLSAEERPVGGLGIFLVRELMDTINYERIDGKNVLTLTKNIDN